MTKTVMVPHTAGSFRVIKSFWLDGKPVQPGATITLDDPSLITNLLSNCKIYPANVETQRRIAPAPSAWVAETKNEPFARIGLPSSLANRRK